MAKRVPRAQGEGARNACKTDHRPLRTGHFHGPEWKHVILTSRCHVKFGLIPFQRVDIGLDGAQARSFVLF